MSYTIYTYPSNFRVQKTLIAAQYAGIDIETPQFDFDKDRGTPDFLKKFPLGKVPAMDTPHGPIFESGAIQRYVGRLRPEAGLYGNSFYQAGQVDQWLDFITCEVDVARGSWLYPVLGYVEFNQEVYDQAKKDMTKILTVLNTHFLNHTYLVSHTQITLADIALACTLTELFRRVFDPTYLVPYGNLVRWYLTCISQPQFEKVLGKIEFAKQEEMAPKPAKEKKEKKTEAPAPAASSSSSSTSSSSPAVTSTKDKKPKDEKPKEEKKPKSDKKDEKPKEEKPKGGDKEKKPKDKEGEKPKAEKKTKRKRKRKRTRRCGPI